MAEQAHNWVWFSILCVLETVANPYQPGCALPWRVIAITASAARSSSGLVANIAKTSTNRTRMGKKRRIILRKKLALVRAQEAARSMTAAEREAVEREKRTKRNREKKVKKKERDKLKKMAEPSVD